MQTGDKIVAPSRGDAATAIDYGVAGNAARQDFMRDYIQMVYALCAQAGTPDASICIAQSVHETSDPGPWQSHWYIERGNVAGMGITGDPQQNEASPWFATGEEAARAQVSHLILYATGTIAAAGLTPADDPRYDAYVEAYGHTIQATTIDGLAGKWGTDPQYATKVCQRGAQIWPNLPDQGDANGGGDVAEIVYGRVPMPEVDVRDIPNNIAWDDLGTRTIRGVVLHRMIGTLWGTDSWFRGGGSASALTDFGVGVAATDGADEAGHLMRWNDPAGRRSPWASGPVNGAYGDGAAFVDLYGVSGVNRDTTAIEISGDYDTPLDAAAFEVIAQFMAHWADAYRIPHTEYPFIPSENRNHSLWHQEFCLGTGKICPGDVVMDQTTALIDRAREIMKQYQMSGAPTPEPEPPQTTYPAKPVKAPDVMESQGFALTFNEPNRFLALQGTSRYTYPNRGAPKASGEDIKRDKTYTFDFATEAPSGNGGKMERWLVSRGGSWCLSSAFAQETE
jgi:hypothetical protein